MRRRSIWRRAKAKSKSKTMTKTPLTKSKVGHTRNETQVVHISFDKSVLDEIKKSAKNSGLSAAAWIRMTAIKEAKACV